MARKYWKRPDCTCKALTKKGANMQKWKRGTIICLGINLLFLYGLFTDYYEFLSKNVVMRFHLAIALGGARPWGGHGVAQTYI